MIDIHCHILPGIDDGPEHIEESVEMAKIAFLDGITTIVATPHIKEPPLPLNTIEKCVLALKDLLAKQNIPVTILQGGDVSAMIGPQLLKGYTINNTPYILIEFPHMYLPGNAKEIIFGMMRSGYHPILTHPERNLAILNNPSLLLALAETGALVQITGDSLTGGFGLDVQECAQYLLKKKMVDVIASDAHSSLDRRPVLSEAVKIAGTIIGQERASRLVTVNPGKIIAGESIGV